MAMNLSHEQAQALIQKGFDSRLDRKEQDSLQDHLNNCQQCTAYFADHEALHERLTRALPERWPVKALAPAAQNRKLDGIHNRLRRTQMNQRYQSFFGLAAGTIGLIGLVFGLFMLVRLSNGPLIGGNREGEQATATPLTAPTLTPTVNGPDSVTREEAEQLVREWIFARNPDMNPAAQFPLEEQTSDDIRQWIGVQVFRVTGDLWQNETFLIQKGNVYQLGTAFGGQGVSQMMVVSLGEPDAYQLLYAFDFGSGLQLSRVGMFLPETSQVLEAGVENFTGTLVLEAVSESMVVVRAIPMGSIGKVTASLLFVRLQDGQLSLLPEHPDLEGFFDKETGISFFYPKGWQSNGSGAFEGSDGFIELRSLQGYSIKTACETLIAQNGGIYGENPSVATTEIDSNPVCTITAGQDGPESVLVIGLPDGKTAMIRTDPAHLTLVQATLRGPIPNAAIGNDPSITQVPPGFKEYEVQAGDTCAGIAGTFGISVQTLIDLNNLGEECTISVGQPLMIPTEGASEAAVGDRLTLQQAEMSLRSWISSSYPQMRSSFQYPLTELTTDEVWERLKMQVFMVADGPWKNKSFVFYHGMIVMLGSDPYNGQGVAEVYTANLIGNEAPELLYAFGTAENLQTIGLLDFGIGDSPTRLESDFTSATLRKIDDTQFEVSTPAGVMGLLAVANDLHPMLTVMPQDGNTKTFVDLNGFLSFQYPANWQQKRETRLEGSDGYVEIGPFGPDGDMLRNCEWMANENPNGRFGSSPQIMTSRLAGQEICVVMPEEGNTKADALMYLPYPGGSGSILVYTDAAHLMQIGGTLIFQSQGKEPRELTPLAPAPANPPMPALTVTKQAGLTVEEWQIVSATEDTPGHFEFSDRVPQTVHDRHAEVRGYTTEERMAETGITLQKYGYALIKNTDVDGMVTYELSHNGENIRRNITLIHYISSYGDSTTNGDFALVVEDYEGTWLVRKNGIEPYDMMQHRYTKPVFAGSKLITVERDDNAVSQYADWVLVKADGQTIFRYLAVPEPTSEVVKGLYGWDGHWAVEINGTLIVDGVNWNQNDFPADEIFDFALVNGKPFFFFERSGKVGIYYDGQELTARYEEVFHYGCCEPAAFNVGANNHMVWFYARREGMWYYVEIGKFQ